MVFVPQLCFQKISPLKNNSYEIIMAENFLQLMSDMKPQIWESLRMPSRKNVKKPLYLGILYSNCRKSKIKKILKEAKKTPTLPIEEQR